MGGGGSRARVAPDDGYEIEYLDAPTTGASGAWGLKENTKGGHGSMGHAVGREASMSKIKSAGRRVINSSVHSLANTVHTAHRKVAQHRRAGGSSSQYRNSEFEIGRVIGTGLYGVVRVAKLKKNDRWCAIKAIRKDQVCAHKSERFVHNERAILTELAHPFIVNLLGTYQDTGRVYLVLEFCAGGELFSQIHPDPRGRKGGRGRGSPCSANACKFYLAEIFLALQCIHEHGYCYRDLKPENIMLDNDGHCKMVDFGFCRACGDGERMKTRVGTAAYLSPEQLNSKHSDGYGRIVDWWSFGIITYELMTGTTPFCRSSKETSYAIYMRVLKGKISFPKKFDTRAKDMVKGLLTPDVARRLVLPDQIQRHEWFEDVDFDAILERRAIPPHIPVLKRPGDDRHFEKFDNSNGNKKNGPIDNSLFVGF